MYVVYEPKGRAREYSELACNLYRGCTHGCRYCYAPACMRTTSGKWHTQAEPRKDVLKLLEKDASRLQGDPRTILFCFLCDPYQPIERRERLTRQAIEILLKNRLNNQVLTKGCADLILEDLDLLKKANTKLGITLSFVDDAIRQDWEPHASPVADRLNILKEAHKAGIYTWLSLEPVIDPGQALSVIQSAHRDVDFWKVGKLNHMKKQEETVDWAKFLVDAETLLKKLGAKYYIKQDLQAFRAKS